MKKRTFLLSLILPLILAGKVSTEEMTIDRIQGDYLPPGSRHQKTLSEEAQGLLDKSRVFIFSLPGSFESALAGMKQKGLELRVWDKEAARRERSLVPVAKKGTSWDPLDLPDFRRATAGKEGHLFILQSHFFDLRKKSWRRGTTLEVRPPIDRRNKGPFFR